MRAITAAGTAATIPIRVDQYYSNKWVNIRPRHFIERFVAKWKLLFIILGTHRWLLAVGRARF
jgi:hypothetical protein